MYMGPAVALTPRQGGGAYARVCRAGRAQGFGGHFQNLHVLKSRFMPGPFTDAKVCRTRKDWPDSCD